MVSNSTMRGQSFQLPSNSGSIFQSWTLTSLKRKLRTFFLIALGCWGKSHCTLSSSPSSPSTSLNVHVPSLHYTNFTSSIECLCFAIFQVSTDCGQICYCGTAARPPSMLLGLESQSGANVLFDVPDYSGLSTLGGRGIY